MSSSTSQPPALPEVFGPYRILRPLGKGGMGAVYLAHDTRLDRNVALKVCLLADDPRALERFRREAKVAAALRHPNLCPIHEYDVRDGIAYLTMDLIEGQTLAQRAADRPLSQNQAALLVAELALALQEAHDKGIIHRDLKPANIILDNKGKPVILDFGLAAFAGAHTKITQEGAVFGTAAYMAPEQASGDPGAVGPAADQYSLGVIFYELLCGAVPFTGTTLNLLFHTVHTPPVPPCQRNPAVSAALEAICLRALAKKATERYASLKKFGEELARTVCGLEQSGARPAASPLLQSTLDWQAAAQSTTESATPAYRPQRDPRNGGRVLRRVLLALIPISLLLAVIYGIYRGWDHEGGTKSASPNTRHEPSPPSQQIDQRTNSLGMTFVHLPRGTFYMGGGSGKAGKQTEIKEDFEIAMHTVSQEQWAALMNGNDKYPSMFRHGGMNAKAVEKISDEDLKRFPVESVSWDMVQDYIEKLNDKERESGWTYRLPLEAEWEYACRGGATSQDECSFDYYLSKPANSLSVQDANIDGGLKRPTLVDDTVYPTNRLGLHHMHGNVWQWCADLYAADASLRLVRGGSWTFGATSCTAAYRVWLAKDRRLNYLGFRLVRLNG